MTKKNTRQQRNRNYQTRSDELTDQRTYTQIRKNRVSFVVNLVVAYLSSIDI